MRRTLIVLMTLGTMLTACLGSTATPGGQTADPVRRETLEKPDTVIGITGYAFSNMPLHIAYLNGYYAEEGLTAKPIVFSATNLTVAALTAGQVQFTSSSLAQVIQTQAQGGDLILIASVNANSANVMIVNNDFPNAKTIKDIKDVTFGVSGLASTPAIAVRSAFALSGLDPKSAKLLDVGSGAAQVAAFQAKRVQAMVLQDPFASQLVSTGQARILYDMRTPEGSRAVFTGNYPGSALTTTQTFLRQNPKTVAAAARAIQKALKFLQESSVEDIVAKLPQNDWFPDGNKADFISVLRNNKAVFNLDGRLTPDQPLIVLRGLGLASPEVDFSKVDLSKTYDHSWYTAPK